MGVKKKGGVLFLGLGSVNRFSDGFRKIGSAFGIWKDWIVSSGILFRWKFGFNFGFGRV